MVTPVSICLASLSKVTRIVLFGLQKLIIHRTKEILDKKKSRRCV